MKKIISIAIGIAFVILVYFSLIIVPQNKLAIVSQSEVLSSGLHAHWPWQKIKWLDLAPQVLQTTPQGLPLTVAVTTFDGHQLLLTYNLLWQISDKPKFLAAFGKQKIDDLMIAASDQTLKNVVATLTVPQLIVQLTDGATLNQLLQNTNVLLTSLGVNVLDLNVISIGVAESERAAWAAQMERQQTAQLELVQKQTATLSQDLHNAVDSKILQMLKTGAEQAAKIKSNGDLAATQIYADAYHQNPEFYEYFHHLQLYKKLLNNKQDVLVFSTHTPFFSALTTPSGSSK